jgi:hypothetical protein
MSVSHPRWRDLSEKSERYNGRLNTLRQRYAMHEATHAEYGVIRARNLKRALQTLKNRGRACDKRNKQFIEEFKAMEERAQHVESVSFAKRALERSLEDFSRILIARRPQWQQQTMRSKEKRLKNLDKEKQKLKAHRLRSAELFKHEMKLNQSLAKKREEANLLQAELRKEELERQLKAEEEFNFQEHQRRDKERKMAEENDKLRSELERLTNIREDAKRQHEIALEAMRKQEERVLIEASTKRYQDESRKSAERIRMAQEAQQKERDTIQKEEQERINRLNTLRQPPRSPVAQTYEAKVQRDEVAVVAPPNNNTATTVQSSSIQDENLAIQKRMQEKMEAEMTLRKFRQEALRVEQGHKRHDIVTGFNETINEDVSSSSLSQSVTTDNVHNNSNNNNNSSLNISTNSNNRSFTPPQKPLESYDWEEWVNVIDLLVQHVQRDQNASTLKLGYGNADRAWGQVFLQSTSDQRREWISMAHLASEENMGSRARREMGNMGMVKWCTAICEVLRCVTDKGIIDADILKEHMNAGDNDKLTQEAVEKNMNSFNDTRIELWQSFVAHLKYLKDKCNLSPLYLSRTFAVYLTPDNLQRMEYGDRTIANLLLKVLVPPPAKSPSRTSLMARTGLGSLTDVDNSFNQTLQQPQAVATISKVSPRKLSPLVNKSNSSSPNSSNNISKIVAAKSTTKKKRNVLDKVRQGYSFGSDDFDLSDDETDDVSTNNITGGSFFNNTSLNPSNNVSLNNKGYASTESGSAAAVSTRDAAPRKDKKPDEINKNVSDVIELEEYDSFDDDF